MQFIIVDANNSDVFWDIQIQTRACIKVAVHGRRPGMGTMGCTAWFCICQDIPNFQPPQKNQWVDSIWFFDTFPNR